MERQVARVSRKDRKRLGWIAPAVARETDGPDAQPTQRTRAEKAFAGEEEFSQSDLSPKRRGVELKPEPLYDVNPPKKKG